LDGAIINIKAVEDDFECGQIQALFQRIIEIFHEVLEHGIFEFWEIAIPATLEGKLYEGWS
jgi:hypothetical protein